MKKLFTFALILLVKTTFAQKDTVGLHVPYTNGAVVYEKVFDAPGKTGAALYSNAMAWIAGQNKSLEGIKFADSVNYRLVTKGIQLTSFKGPVGSDIDCKIHYSLQIDCRDGKYRCRISNILFDCKLQDTFTATPEDLMQQLLKQKSDPNFTNNMAKTALQTLNSSVTATVTTLDKTMNDTF